MVPLLELELPPVLGGTPGLVGLVLELLPLLPEKERKENLALNSPKIAIFQSNVAKIAQLATLRHTV